MAINCVKLMIGQLFYVSAKALMHRFTQKHHQEEISGPLDTIKAAPLAKDLPRPKRARIQSRKALENRAQSQSAEVLSLRPANFSIGRNTTPLPQQQPLSNSQNSSQQAEISTADRQKKEEWQQQFESAKSKLKQLEILREHIGDPRPYPEKLNVPTPPDPGRPLLQPHQYKPLDLFHRFIPLDLLPGIAEHTNQYADENRPEIFTPQRAWQEVTAAEIGGYIGAVLLIGAQAGGRDLAYYWNQQDNLPDWPVAEYISRQRFQQIARYLKLNRPGDLPDDQWYKKVEPLATRFREATTAEIYQLPQHLSIDEQLIRFKGRSKHIIQMNSKAAGQGYKIYSLCCANGYMVDFRFTSGQQKVAQLTSYSGFSASESVVLDLAHTLLKRFPRPTPFYVLHLDNFFTTRRLYQKLYELGIGANGTAKAGSGIPKELACLGDAMTKQKDHGEWFNYVIESVNCIAFCDMASKAMMTTIHDPTTEEYAYFDARKRPGASLKYAIAAESVEDSSQPQLRKLYALEEYNQYMGGSDNHAKQNSFYSTAQHYHRRNWLPLFYMLLDGAVTNAYILYKQGIIDHKLSHAEFQEEIARGLLRAPGAILRRRRPNPISNRNSVVKATRKNGERGHYWTKLDTYRVCQVCSAGTRRRGRKRHALQETSGNVPDSANRGRRTVHRTIYS
jgi:Transposase IS4